MPLPPKLEKEIEELRSEHPNITVTEESDMINLVFPGFALGEGYSVATSDVLLRVPRSYNDAGPDMFWTGVEVTLKDGKIPQAAENIENHLGHPWRRFSWHRTWNPTCDNIHNNLEFIRKRLREKK